MQYQSCFLNNFVTPTFPVPMSSSYCSQMYPVRTYCSCMFRIRFTLRWFKTYRSYWSKQFYPSTQRNFYTAYICYTDYQRPTHANLWESMGKPCSCVQFIKKLHFCISTTIHAKIRIRYYKSRVLHLTMQ